MISYTYLSSNITLVSYKTDYFIVQIQNNNIREVPLLLLVAEVFNSSYAISD